LLPESLATILQSRSLALGLDACGVLMLLLYHFRLARVCRTNPDRTYRGRSNRLRHAWVAVMRARGVDVISIQTMRNWVMSATLLASTSILIGLGAAHVAFATEHPNALAAALSILPPPGETLTRIKLLVLSGIFFSAFHDFARALRHYNHVGFLINLPDADIPGDPVKSVAVVLNWAGSYYNFGTRKFLLAAPVAMWLIGPIWFLAGVLVTLWVLYRYDYRRVGEGEEPVRFPSPDE
jgi:uncharacterized membrane protein